MPPFIPPEHRPDVELGIRIIARILARNIVADHHERLAQERAALSTPPTVSAPPKKKRTRKRRKDS